jgi:hypothetical protein
MDFAGKKNREFRQLSQLAGVRISDDFNTIREWRTKEGGGVFACSVDQHIVGRGFDTIIVDDPLGSAVDADNGVKRDEVDKAIRFLMTRLHPGGSIIINASPFHQDDPIGRRKREPGWLDVSAPAIIHDPGRRPLWPERWSLADLDKMRQELAVDDPAERTWSAQWMCDPQPPGLAEIHDPYLYTKIPDWGFRIGYGADLAFTQGATSDWAAFVAMKITGGKGYVLEVARTKLDAHMIESTLKAFTAKYGRGPIYSYMSGPEVGFARLMRERGLPFVNMLARWNKAVRNHRTVDRHNAGDIQWPANAPWLPDVMRRAKSLRFNEKDVGDDEWDALASVCDAMLGGVGAGSVKTMGRSYEGLLNSAGGRNREQTEPKGFWRWDGRG